MEPQVLKILFTVRSAWRFKWLGLAIAVMVFVLGAAAVLALPSKYESTARVFVDTTSLLGPALEGLAVQNNTLTRVEAVRRALVSRPQLEKVIDSTGLKKRARNDMERAAVLGDLASQIKLQASAAANQREASFFTISYRDKSPRLAYEVVQHLVEALQEGTSSASQADAESTEKFLTSQIAEVADRLNAAEAKLAEFKRRNIGAMPDDRGDYFQRIQAEMTRLDQAQSQLAIAMSQRSELQSKLTGSGTQSTGQESGSGVMASSYDTQIAEAKTKLEQLLLRFTDAHPEVVAQREAIAAMERQRQEELAALRTSGRNLGTIRSGTGSVVLQNLQVALNDVEVKSVSLRSEVANSERRLADLRKSANTMPEIEAELSRLTRDYGTTKTQYESLLKRLESVRLAGQASEQNKGQFRIVDPPAIPLLAVFPKRLLMLLALFAGSAGLGAAIAYLASLMRPVVVDETDFQARFPGLKIGGVVMQIRSAAEIRSEAWSTSSFLVACGIFVVFAGGILAKQAQLGSLVEQLLWRPVI